MLITWSYKSCCATWKYSPPTPQYSGQDGCVGFLFATSVDTAAYWFVYKLYINLVEDTPVGRGYFIKNDCIFNTALIITDELLILILTFY